MDRLLDKVTIAILAVFATLGPWGLFALMVAEQACIPLPNEVIVLGAGFLVSQGRPGFTLPITIAAAVAGSVVGASIAYFVARCLGRPLLERYGRYLLITPARLDVMQAWFDRHGWKTVLFGRWITGLRSSVSLPAGLARMPYPKFIACTLLGTGSWVVTGVLLGRLVGEEWQRILHLVKRANYLVLVALVVAVLLVWFAHWVSGRSPRQSNSERGDAE